MRAFWIVSGVVLFVLAVFYFSLGLGRRNVFFSAWLCAGLAFQIFAAIGLAAGTSRPPWMAQIKVGFDLLSYLIGGAAIVLAAARRNDPVNSIILHGLLAMVILRLLALFVADGHSQLWARNIAFFGPALWMLYSFSGAEPGRLVAWAQTMTDSRFKIQEAVGWARSLLSRS